MIMLHTLTIIKSWTITMMLMVLVTTSLVECKAIVQPSLSIRKPDSILGNFIHVEHDQSVRGGDQVASSRQIPVLKGVNGETSAPDFIRLVVMRLIYGLASTMGVEERLEGLFNGAFVPPNADGDIFGLSGYDDGGAGVADFDVGDFEGLFDGDDF